MAYNTIVVGRGAGGYGGPLAITPRGFPLDPPAGVLRLAGERRLLPAA